MKIKITVPITLVSIPFKRVSVFKVTEKLGLNDLSVSRFHPL